MRGEANAAMTADGALVRLGALPGLVDADAGLVRRGRFLDVEMMVGVGDRGVCVSVRAGRVVGVAVPGLMRPWTFAVRGSVRGWEAYWRAVPAPGWHDLFALSKRGEMRFEGELQPFVANLQYVKDLLALPRRLERGV